MLTLSSFLVDTKKDDGNLGTKLLIVSLAYVFEFAFSYINYEPGGKRMRPRNENLVRNSL